MKWIRVKEALPIDGQRVIVYGNADRPEICTYDGEGVMFIDDCEGDIQTGITHWMPLPEAP